MDQSLFFLLVAALVIAALYFLSLLLRSSPSPSTNSSSSSHSNKAATPKKAVTPVKKEVVAVKTETPVHDVDADEDDVQHDGNHSVRWNSFVNGRLSKVAKQDASALPGIGKVYATKWKQQGYETAYAVLGCYLRHGAAEFSKIATEIVGMRANAAEDLLSAIESRWNTLILNGESLSELKKNKPESDGVHSVRYSIFVSAKLSDVKMEDTPGLGEKYISLWAEKGVTKVSQLFGQYLLFNGDRAKFDSFSERTVGMRNVGKNDSIGDLGSAIETKWNALALHGT